MCAARGAKSLTYHTAAGPCKTHQLRPSCATNETSPHGLASHVEAEVDDVAILHDVVLALDADLAFLAGGGDAAGGDEVVVVDDLRADEAALEVRVNLAGGFRCRRALDDGPGAALIRAGCQESLEAQEVEGCLDQAVEAALRLAEVFEEGLGLFFVELSDFRLDFAEMATTSAPSLAAYSLTCWTYGFSS